MRIKVDLDGGVRLMWPTPVLQRVFPGGEALNPRLLDIIHQREALDSGTSKSVVNGWHSTEDVMGWPEPEIGQLRDWIIEAVKAITVPTTGQNDLQGVATISAWANILRNGGYHRLHSHPGSAWSGVYYIDTGKPDKDNPKSGILELYDPRTAVEMIPLPTGPFGLPLPVEPKPGMMVVFPSWLRHMVHPFFGEGERVTIAWNLRLDDYNAK